MESAATSCLDPNDIRELLLDIAQQREVQKILDLVVERLATQSQVALARVWLVRSGDICERCHMRAECVDRSKCLHLAASAGAPRTGAGSWQRLGGAFRRFPMGVGKVGRIAATGVPVEVEDILERSEWIARPDWARSERLRGFGGQALLCKGEVLGVLAVFARAPMLADNLIWLRMLVDHMATAIANARAFEEIDLPVRAPTPGSSPVGILSDEELKQRKLENMRAALHAAHWKVSGPGGAAELLGVKPTTLASRMKAAGLRRPSSRRPTAKPRSPR